MPKYHPPKNNLISSDEHDDSDNDVDYVVTNNMLKDTSDTECEGYQDTSCDDEFMGEFNKTIAARYGGRQVTYNLRSYN